MDIQYLFASIGFYLGGLFTPSLLIFTFLDPWLPNYKNKLFTAKNLAVRFFAGSTILFWVYDVSNQPEIAPTFLFYIVPAIAVVNIAVALLKHFVLGIESEMEALVKIGAFLLILLILPIGNWIHGKAVLEELGNLPKVEVTEASLEELDQETLPLVTKGAASYRMDKRSEALENPSAFVESTPQISNINNQLMFTATTDFSSGRKAYRYQQAPGFYTLLATETSASATFVKQELRYTESSVFHNQLERKLRQQFPSTVFFGTDAEVDDKGKLYFVTSYGHYQFGNKGIVIEGVIVTDPSTGKGKKHKLGQVPQWVDQVFPVSVAEEHFTDWGTKRLGWKKQRQQDGTSNPGTVYETFNRNKELVYVTYFTRSSGSQGSMSEIGIMNARTGKITVYTDTTDLVTGAEALSVVKSSDYLTNKPAYSPTYPTLFNVYGEPTYITPVYDDKHRFRMLGIVHASGESETVALGTTKEEAFELYKQLLSGRNKEDVLPDSQKKEKTATGKIVRIGSQTDKNGTTWIFTLAGIDRLFAVKGNDELAVTIPGDLVTVVYFEVQDGTLPVKSFDNTVVPNQP